MVKTFAKFVTTGLRSMLPVEFVASTVRLCGTAAPQVGVALGVL